MMKVQTLAKWLHNSEHAVVMTGAGMSTESGLPDFRSNEGLWSGTDPAQLASTEAFIHNQSEFISFYQTRIKQLEKVKPNEGHFLLADWEKTGKIRSIITQNVDGLHQEAGSQNIAELHGTLATVRCHECDQHATYTAFLQHPPLCSHCGGVLRPNIVLFGEILPERAIRFSQSEVNQADLFIVLGSSLSVTPAASFPLEAKNNKKEAKLVIINRTETELDGWADLLIQEKSINDVLKETASHL